MNVTRRQFMVGCSTAIAAMAGGRVSNVAFATEASANATDEILVVVFLRGGCDGLSVVAPYDDPTYVRSRGQIAIPGKGPNAALDLVTGNSTITSSMGLHPHAGPLKELYDARKLAIVHACGLDNDTRSHFEAMDFMERGTPGNSNTANGWITRHLDTSPAGGLLPTLAASSSMPASLRGDSNAVAMSNAGRFAISAPWRYLDGEMPHSMVNTLKTFYNGSSPLDVAGKRTLDVMETLKARQLVYTPEPSALYPKDSFGDSLKLVAQMVKLDLGLRVSTVDFGGWDTHDYQGNEGTGYFADRVGVLARGLHAFMSDLDTFEKRLTVVVMSEFGRRLGVNSSSGTDHGHGNVMLVLGGNVNGGKIHGRWPGLEDLDQNQDLRITTDYRTVLSEILIRRLANPNLATVFPGFSGYKPLGVMRGTDLQPVTPPVMQHKVYVPMIVR
jgi:uncharacterized protein (DUF1501 family)